MIATFSWARPPKRRPGVRVGARPGLGQHRRRPAVGPGRQGERASSRPRPLDASRRHVAQICGHVPFDRDGEGRLLQPQLGQRLLVREAGRGVLQPERLPPLGRRREPPLGLAPHRRGTCDEALAQQRAAPPEPARPSLARHRALRRPLDERSRRLRQLAGHDRHRRLRRP